MGFYGIYPLANWHSHGKSQILIGNNRQITCEMAISSSKLWNSQRFYPCYPCEAGANWWVNCLGSCSFWELAFESPKFRCNMIQLNNGWFMIGFPARNTIHVLLISGQALIFHSSVRWPFFWDLGLLLILSRCQAIPEITIWAGFKITVGWWLSSGKLT